MLTYFILASSIIFLVLKTRGEQPMSCEEQTLTVDFNNKGNERPELSIRIAEDDKKVLLWYSLPSFMDDVEKLKNPNDVVSAAVLELARCIVEISQSDSLSAPTMLETIEGMIEASSLLDENYACAVTKGIQNFNHTYGEHALVQTCFKRFTP